jgi:hypothetical protein
MTQRTFTTPDGRLRVDFNEFPMRMSHIVCNPRVIFVPTGEVVLDLFDTLWDGSVSADEGRLRLELREYSGSQPSHTMIYDPDEGTSTREEGRQGRHMARPRPHQAREAPGGKPAQTGHEVDAATAHRSTPQEIPSSASVHRGATAGPLAAPGACDRRAADRVRSGFLLARVPPLNGLSHRSALRLGVGICAIVFGLLGFVCLKWIYRPKR